MGQAACTDSRGDDNCKVMTIVMDCATDLCPTCAASPKISIQSFTLRTTSDNGHKPYARYQYCDARANEFLNFPHFDLAHRTDAFRANGKLFMFLSHPPRFRSTVLDLLVVLYYRFKCVGNTFGLSPADMVRNSQSTQTTQVP